MAEEEASLLSGLSKVLNFLYGKDILSEECIIEWHESSLEEGNGKAAQIRKAVSAQLISF